MDAHPYLTTLWDAEWELVRPLLPPPPRTGHPRRHRLRTLRDATCSAVRAGHAWRRLPGEWPPGKTVYHYCRQWRLDGTWGAIHTALRESLRRRVGREPPPSAGIIARPVGQVERAGGATRLRRRQAGVRAQAAPRGGHAAVAPQGGRPPRQPARTRRRQTARAGPRPGISPPAARLGRPGLRRGAADVDARADGDRA